MRNFTYFVWLLTCCVCADAVAIHTAATTASSGIPTPSGVTVEVTILRNSSSRGSTAKPFSRTSVKTSFRWSNNTKTVSRPESTPGKGQATSGQFVPNHVRGKQFKHSLMAQPPFRNISVANSTMSYQPKTNNPIPYQPKPNEVCIDFTFDNPNWHWTKQPPWGHETGSFGSLENGRMCFGRSDIGGALFIGSYANPSEGTTKLECTFGESSDTAYCNMSLVDGFSLPVTCTMGDKMMGGNIDLWDQGVPCPDERKKHLGICTNNREEVAEHKTPAFFQPAIKDGHNYCIWTSCTQIPAFRIGSEIKCHVGSTKLSLAA